MRACEPEPGCGCNENSPCLAHAAEGLWQFPRECQRPLDIENRDSALCGDEGRMCEHCFERESAYWSDYFGLRTGDKVHNQNQIEAFRPPLREGES